MKIVTTFTNYLDNIEFFFKTFVCVKICALEINAGIKQHLMIRNILH